MGVAFYTDVHIPGPIVVGLRMRGVDVLTAQDDEAWTLEDDELLARSTTLGRVLISFDDDLLKEATKLQRAGLPFPGVVFTRPLEISIGQCIQDLELIAKALSPEEIANQVLYIPL